MPSISEIIGPETVKQLYDTEFEANIEEVPKKRDAYSSYREILDTHPELKDKIVTVFSQKQSIPAIHITSRSFKSSDGEISTGFVENIMDNGFKEKDTNVGVFMSREGTRNPATPEDFIDQPEKFLRELETLLNHYYHHGVRTNKNQLEVARSDSIGIPVMLLIDVSNVKLIPGSDYEDHYQLAENVPGTRVIGTIDLEGIGSRIHEDLPAIATEFLEQIDRNK